MEKTKQVILTVVALVAISTIVATSGADVVSHHETDVLEIGPAGEGIYTQIDDETGEINIILTEGNPNVDGKGVNGNAITDIGQVFTLENVLKQQREATVWIDHDSEAVTFYVPNGDLIESQEEGVTLQPGESTTVALRIDTRETSEITLKSIDVLATLNSPVETPDDTDDSGGSTDTATGTPTSTDSDGSKPTQTDTPYDAVTSTPNGTNSSTVSPTATSTPANNIEEAGFNLRLLAALLALIAAVGGCAFLARRYGYV